MEVAIQIFVNFFGIYVLIGVLFAIYFFLKGARQLDELIADSSWKVRLLLVPGAISLWPILVRKLILKSRLKS